MNKGELNSLYQKWEDRATAITSRLNDLRVLNYNVQYYNGHYGKNAAGEYEKEFYPIPVISVEGLCDIEVEFDSVAVSSRLGKDAALKFDYDALKDYKFEAYGVEDYLADYYVEGNTFDELIENIKKSQETEIEFQFSFPYDCNVDRIVDLIVLLQTNGFYF